MDPSLRTHPQLSAEGPGCDRGILVCRVPLEGRAPAPALSFVCCGGALPGPPVPAGGLRAGHGALREDGGRREQVEAGSWGPSHWFYPSVTRAAPAYSVLVLGGRVAGRLLDVPGTSDSSRPGWPCLTQPFPSLLWLWSPPWQTRVPPSISKF